MLFKSDSILNQKINFSSFVNPGDSILWSQATAEPLPLTQMLVEQRSSLGGCSVFIGAGFSDTLQTNHSDWLRMRSFGGLGKNHKLIATGALKVIPVHASQLCSMIDNRKIQCDVAMLQLSPPGPDGKHSMGIASDYMASAARSARVVVAEVNSQMPWTSTSDLLDGIHIDKIIYTDRPLIEVTSSTITDTASKIAKYAAEFINDRFVLELGIGTLADSVLSMLTDRKDLGIHSGVISDSILDLVSKGVITNGHKNIDSGLITTATLLGTKKLNDFANNNKLLRLRPYSYTHSHEVLAQIDNFTAINSVLEVDLTGQVNSQSINGKYIGAIGGIVDFMRGALSSKNGRSIILLPSTSKDGLTSRIVTKLSNGFVTSESSYADVVVTEWGAAQLRNQPLNERIKRLIAIAHPAHRDKLSSSSHLN